MLAISSVITYSLLVLLWSAILVLYLRQRRRTTDRLLVVLLSLLALDALKSVIENTYFGLVWASRYGFLGSALDPLSQPGPLTAIKCLNLVVASTVLYRLLGVWIPSRVTERALEHDKLEGLTRLAGESAERFRVAFNTVPDALSIARLSDGVIVAVNDGFCQSSGWPEREIMLGKTSVDLNLWVKPEIRKSILASLLAEGYVRDVEIPFRRKNGTEFTALTTSRVFEVSGEKYFLSVSRDITGQRRAESAQAAIYRIAEAASSSGTLRSMLAEVHGIVATLIPVPNFYIALLDEKTQTLSFPYFVDEIDDYPQGPQKLGRGLTEHVLRTGQPFLHRDQQQFRSLVEKGEAQAIGTPAKSWIGVPLRAQGRTMGVLAAQIYSGEMRYDPRDTELLQFVSTQIASAIEKKQAEIALRANEERFRALIESTSDGICLLDAEGGVHYASAAANQLLGHVQGEPLSTISSLLHPEDVPALELKLREALAHPRVPILAQFRVRRRDGSSAILEGVLTNLLEESAVGGIVLNIRDLTDRKRMEAQLMMSDRMASVGILAAGVAHEINTPLAFVIGNLALLEEELIATPGGQPWAESLRACQEGAERVRRIVRDLKTFSRADEDRSGPVDVHLVLDSAANLAQNELRHRARLERSYQPNLPLVLASEGRLGQVILNLLVNAAHAMPESGGGRIELVTRSTAGEVMIEVRDNGAGIRPEHRARLFDPFFTTKPAGVGTGLGLFICQQIIGSMGGTICVESELGKGSIFRVSLPIGAGSSSAATPERATEVLAAKGSRILAIDDEPQMGTLLKHTLKAHELVAITSAAEALDRIRAGERFQLLICDLMMPHMTGMDLHAALSREFPDQARRMLFLTGGAFTARARDFIEGAGVPWVQKPFVVSEMRVVVADRLALLA